MKKLIVTLLICCGALGSQAQLSVHLGSYGSTPAGLNVAPYDFSFFDFSLLYGGEIGYRVEEWFGLYGFIYAGSSDKEIILTFGNTEADSRYTLWGLRPQFEVASSSSGVFNFDIGVPLAFLHQDLEWSDSGERLFFDTEATAGRDQAKFFRTGIAPTLRFLFEEPRLSLQIVFNVNYDHVLSAQREFIIPENQPDGFGDTEVRNRRINMGVNFTFGYSFW